jgi:hypothetical protein
MLRNRTKFEKRVTAVSPLGELRLHGIRDMREFREVPVMETQAPSEFPDSLDGVKVRAIRRKEEQLECWLLFSSPCFVHAGVMISSVIDDNHDASTGTTGYLPQVSEKAPGGLGVEFPWFLLGVELAVAKANGPEIPHRLARRVVQQDRIPDFRRNPHPASRAMLLKMDFIDGPQVYVWIGRQFAEFFYKRPAPRDRHERSAGAVCEDETPIAERAAGIGEPATSGRTPASGMLKESCHPRLRRLSCRPPLASFAIPAQSDPFARCPADVGDRLARLPPIRKNLAPRSAEPSIPPFWAHPQATGQLLGRSRPGPPAELHAVDGRTATLQCDESRLALPESYFHDQIWLRFS